MRGPVSPGASKSVDGRGRDLADEVLVLPARDGAGGRAGGLRVGLAGRGDDAAQAAVRAQMPGERSRVHAGDRGDVVVAEERRELAGVVEHRGGGVRDDERAQPRPDRLVVVREAPVVADERIGHHDDLAGIRGVRADLLVAGLAGVDDEVAASGHGRPERHAREDGPVLERQQRGTEVPDPGIDDRTRARRRWDDHRPADTTNPPASRARWARTCGDIQPPSPASRDRYASLTGLAMKGRRQGSIPGARRGWPRAQVAGHRHARSAPNGVQTARAKWGPTDATKSQARRRGRKPGSGVGIAALDDATFLVPAVPAATADPAHRPLRDLSAVPAVPVGRSSAPTSPTGRQRTPGGCRDDAHTAEGRRPGLRRLNRPSPQNGDADPRALPVRAPRGASPAAAPAGRSSRVSRATRRAAGRRRSADRRTEGRSPPGSGRRAGRSPGGSPG